MISAEEFLELSGEYNLIPVYKEIIADTETPVSIYRRLSGFNDYSFLLESADFSSTSEMGRYSFIGLYPEKIIKKTDNGVTVSDKEGEVELYENKQLNKYLNNYLAELNIYEDEELPPFSGGFVGYFGYEMIEEWEELYHNQPDKELKKSQLPESILVMASLLVVYDHLNNTLKIIDNIKIKDNMDRKERLELYLRSRNRVNELIASLGEGDPGSDYGRHQAIAPGDLISNTGREEFCAMVEKGKKHIREGDIFQIVLSQKFSIEVDIPAFEVYRALRVSNPSPYLFYLNFPEIKLIGSSPEVLVRVNGDQVITRPLAGTRRRGDSSSEDEEYRNDLLKDEKERAEHVMLVDLGRNDLGRVCEIGSVEVTELMGIEYFTRVMHLVSQVEGKKLQDITSAEILESVFPAGTVSGAPKIRAVELINELEKEPRGPYAGAVGYLDFKGNLDTCITIRTFSMVNNKLSVQVGAGIVADSVPEKEFQETINKAQALFEALDIVAREVPYGLSN
ncbi:MAG: anthranilate synthase component I [Halanaerobiaceae bacterium]